MLAGGTFSSFAEAIEGSNFSDDTEGVYFKNPDKSHETEEVTQTQIQNLVDATRNCNIRLLRLNSWNLNSGHVKWLAPMLLKVEVNFSEFFLLKDVTSVCLIFYLFVKDVTSEVCQNIICTLKSARFGSN